MSDVITLSSDEEYSPPKKKAKPTILIGLQGITITPIPKNGNIKKARENSQTSQENIVVLSDDEDIKFDVEGSVSNTVNQQDINISNDLVVIDDAEDCEIATSQENSRNVSPNSLTTYDANDCEIRDNKTGVCETTNISDSNPKNHLEDDCEIIETKTYQIEKKSFRSFTDKENISHHINTITKETDSGKDELNEINPRSNKLSSEAVKELNSQPSTSKYNFEEKPPQTIILENFLNICEKNVKDSEYTIIIEKIPVLLRYYKKCESTLGDCNNFKQLLVENIKQAHLSPARSVISFTEVFQYIKNIVNYEGIEVTEKVRIKLKKFEKAIKLLTKKIHCLENSEVNFDDEEDSEYIQLDRYTNRLKKIYEKYCQLLKRNPNYGRLTYAKLDFVASDYNEINRAICKKYKNNKKFPSYYEMETFIRKIVREHNLQLNETNIKVESSHCFKKLGELLQSRRQRELYDVHYDYIKNNTDPATSDTLLNNQLKENYIHGQKNIDKLCHEYVVKQELGGEVELSDEDSDKSDYIDSENEDINQTVNKEEIENIESK